MAEIDLQEHFPDMRPMNRAPLLFRINGCGLSVHGARDRDEQTGTYIKTRCLCLLFVPVLALGAYRVANAAQGWYFLGRERLSGLAVMWNLLVLATAVGVGGVVVWSTYTGTAEYKAGQALAQADDLVATGNVVGAAHLYRDVALGGTQHAGAASNRLAALVNGRLLPATLRDATAVLAVAVQVKRSGRGQADLGDLFLRSQTLIAEGGASDPEGALALLEAVAPVAPDDAALRNARLPLLQQIVAHNPDKVEYVSALAVIYEGQGDVEKCRALLAPRADKLGLSEGARVLGQIYANEGDFQRAYALLEPYAGGRLRRLHVAEQKYDNVVDGAWKRVIGELENGKGPQSFYTQYDRASESGRQELVNQYVQSRTKDDPAIKAARETLVREASIVPVALDLGMVQLRRAQTLADADARRQALESAEKTFLAIRGVAGESDTYRIYLGQVYYWLGKHDEGKGLFDEVLSANNRGFKMLVTVGRTLRDLGAESEARALVEEAFNTAKKEDQKHEAAAFRAIMEDDDDEKIVWLRRSNPAAPEVKAELATIEGHKAQREDRSDEAAALFRRAIAAYASMTPSTSSLNNGGLVYCDLFDVTADRDDFKKGVRMLDQAVAMSPSDAILLFNMANVLVQGVVLDLVGDRIDFAALRTSPVTGMLPYLYRDEAGRAVLTDRFRAHPDAAKALSYLDKVLVLAPKGVRGYAAVANTMNASWDLEGLSTLLERVRGATLDLSDSQNLTREHLSGARDSKSLADLDRAMKMRTAAQERAKAAASPLTFAVAAGQMALQMVAADVLPHDVDADAVVRLAEQAHASAPSSATHDALTSALLLRAHHDLRGQHADYRTLADELRRSLEPPYIVSLAAEVSPALRTAVVANADVQRVAAMEVEQASRFPADRGGQEWALFRYVDPQEAARAAEAIRRDRPGLALRTITVLLNPMDATAAYELYWTATAAGAPDEGVRALKACADLGVPVQMPAGK